MLDILWKSLEWNKFIIYLAPQMLDILWKSLEL